MGCILLLGALQQVAEKHKRGNVNGKTKRARFRQRRDRGEAIGSGAYCKGDGNYQKGKVKQCKGYVGDG